MGAETSFIDTMKKKILAYTQRYITHLYMYITVIALEFLRYEEAMLLQIYEDRVHSNI